MVEDAKANPAERSQQRTVEPIVAHCRAACPSAAASTSCRAHLRAFCRRSRSTGYGKIVDVVEAMPQERSISWRCPFRSSQEELAEVSSLTPQEHTSGRIVELRKEIGDVINRIPQERNSECIVKEIINSPVPHIRDSRAEVVTVIPKRVEQRTGELLVDVPVP